MIFKDHYENCTERDGCQKCARYLRTVGKREKQAAEPAQSPNPSRAKLPAIAIDFDGVIHDHKNPVLGGRMGAPISGARDAVFALSLTHRIIVHSVWANEKGRGAIAAWLDYYGIAYDEVTNEKPQAEYYVDDKAIRFTDWQNTLKFITMSQ